MWPLSGIHCLERRTYAQSFDFSCEMGVVFFFFRFFFPLYQSKNFEMITRSVVISFLLKIASIILVFSIDLAGGYFSI